MNTALLIINIGVMLIMLDQIRNIRKLVAEQNAKISALESQLAESSEVQAELNALEADLTPTPKTDA